MARQRQRIARERQRGMEDGETKMLKEDDESMTEEEENVETQMRKEYADPVTRGEPCRLYSGDWRAADSPSHSCPCSHSCENKLGVILYCCYIGVPESAPTISLAAQ